MSSERTYALSDEDIRIINGTSAMAVFLHAVASGLLSLAEYPNGAALQDSLLKEVQESLKMSSRRNAHYPMSAAEREKLKQYYRVFLAFYRHPHQLANFPSGSTKH